MHVAGQIFLPAVEYRGEIYFPQYRTRLHCEEEFKDKIKTRGLLSTVVYGCTGSR